MNVKEMSSELKGCFTSVLIQVSEDMLGYNDVTPRVGDCYQAEIPSLPTSSGFGTLSDVSINFGVGIPIPVTWVRNQSRNNIEEATNCQVIVTNKCETLSIKSGHVSSKQQDVECEAACISLRTDGCKHTSTKSDSQDCNCSPLPGPKVEVWGVIEQSLFLLGLYIFGKNLTLVKKFVDTKTMGDVLSYYYGPFYRSMDYRKWSEGRKSNNKRWIHGVRIFMGWRLKELISRLSFYLSEERQKMLIEGSRMVGEDRITLEEYVFTLKDWFGSDVLVDAISIGKGKRDLTGIGSEPLKATHSEHTRADLSVGKVLSSLSSVEILKVLTGHSRLSKGRSSDLFFDAVWPRLLARGWQSVQPIDSFSKLSLIYLPPGILEFSQGLIKGDEYFDSISDILKKVASDPELLQLGEEALQSKKDPAKDIIICCDSKQDETLSKYQQHSYLNEEPLLHRCDSIKVMVVDTSLASEGDQKKVREFRSLPVSRNNINKSRVVIDLNVPRASLNSVSEEEAITNDMQNHVNLSADSKSHISDRSNDPNAPEIEGVENGRRQSTRNRPSAKALEAIAYGFLDTKNKRRKTMSNDNSNSHTRIQAKSTDEPIVNNIVGNVA